MFFASKRYTLRLNGFLMNMIRSSDGVLVQFYFWLSGSAVDPGVSQRAKTFLV
jgi:hypothetical protein